MSHDNGFHGFKPVGTVFGSAVIFLFRCDFEILLTDMYSHLTRCLFAVDFAVVTFAVSRVLDKSACEQLVGSV